MDRNMATGELWMREAVKEMMVKHLGFGASVGTNWMLLESDLVASIAAHVPKQPEWEAKEKALQRLAIKMSCVAHNSVVYAHEIEAILNSGEQP